MSKFCRKGVSFEEGHHPAGTPRKHRERQGSKRPREAPKRRKYREQKCRNYAPLSDMRVLMSDDDRIASTFWLHEYERPKRSREMT